MAVMAQAPSRRDRLRAATTQEIIQTARRLLVQHGAEAVSLRAIAREMGMTAPALYRYFGSHEELLRHVVADIFTEIADHVRTAIQAAADAADPAGSQAESMAIKMIAGCRAFRAWALEHVPEFSMLFGSPIPGLEYLHQVNRDPATDCGYEFGQLFLDLFGNLYRRRPFPIPADEDVQPGARRAAGELPGPDRDRPAAWRAADVPALLGAAVRLGQPGGLRPPAVRAR